MADEKAREFLIVTAVGTVKEYSGNPVVNFQAKTEGKEGTLGYETWGKELVSLVIVDARLDCDITHTVKNGQPVHRVTQMYDAQGSPIRPQQRRGGGGGSYGKSDAQLQQEIIATGGQNAYSGIIELLKGGVIGLEHVQAKTALAYAEKKMRASLAAGTSTLPTQPQDDSKDTRAARPTPSEKVQAKATSAAINPKADAVQRSDVTDGFALERIAHDVFGLQPKEIWAKLGYQSVKAYHKAAQEEPYEAFLKLKRLLASEQAE